MAEPRPASGPQIVEIGNRRLSGKIMLWVPHPVAASGWRSPSVLYTTPSDPDAFDRHYQQVHLPLAKRLPGLRRYSLSREVTLIRGAEPYYLIAQLEWDDLASLRAAFVSGIALSGFFDGVLLLGVNDAVVEHNAVTDSGEDAVLGALLERPRIRFNELRDSSRGAGAVLSRDVAVVGNRVSGNDGEGIGVEESQHAVVRDNVLTDNAGGIAALDLPGGPRLSDVTISGNDISTNTRLYRGDLVESGLGVAVAGAAHVVIEGNRIWRNTAMAAGSLSGGIRILSTRPFGGTDPQDVLVRRNIVTRNVPRDVWWDGRGAGIRFVGNTCQLSIPLRICSGRS